MIIFRNMKVVFTVLKVLITSEPVVWSLVISIICRGEATQQVAKGFALFQLNVSEDLERWFQNFWLRYLTYEVGF